MTVQVNSDSTVSVDVRTTRFVRDEAERILKSLADHVTRVEVHLSDVNSGKRGPADKRCLVEVRPAGAPPRSVSATAATVPLAVRQALRKAQRSLRSFVDKHGRSSPAAARRARTAGDEPASAAEPAAPAAPKPRATKASAAKQAAAEPRKKKKGIFLARRKAWPSR